MGKPIDFKNCSIEDFVHLLVNEKKSFESIEKDLDAVETTEEEIKEIKQRLVWANERIHKNLDFETRLFLIIFPFGYTHRLYQNSFFDVDEMIERGFVSKVNQYRYYSILGIIFNIFIVILIDFLLR